MVCIKWPAPLVLLLAVEMGADVMSCLFFFWLFLFIFFLLFVLFLFFFFVCVFSTYVFLTLLARLGKMKKETPRFRFRRLVRTVLLDLKFERARQSDDARATSASQPTSRFLSYFDVTPFLADSGMTGQLSMIHKRILRTPVMFRTPRDAKELEYFVRRLRCLDRYAGIAHAELARILHYDAFLPGTVLLQQGHTGQAFYFIVSGRVTVQVRDDKHPEGFRIINEMKPGDSFGELALMEENNIRTATVICLGPCEFLRMNRHEFNQLLKATYQRDLLFKDSTLRSPNAFAGWREAQLKDLLTHTHRRVFRRRTVIFRGSTGGEACNFVVVIASGSARLLRALPVKQHPTKGTLTLSTTTKPSLQQRQCIPQRPCISVTARRMPSLSPATSSSIASAPPVRSPNAAREVASHTKGYDPASSSRKERGGGMRKACCSPYIWVTSDRLPVGSVISSWDEYHALVSEGCECLLLPRAVFFKIETGLALIKARTTAATSTNFPALTFLLHATDRQVFQAFNASQRWDHFKYQLSTGRV
eukprot:m.196200 g.196200  ORF g.196200 m.196200 type:complete len:533 (-) comp16813_c1_seq3:211-1809(-)